MTGSNGGVGSAIAGYLLAKTESNVVLHVHRERGVADELLAKYVGRTRVVSADLCSEEQVAALAQQLEKDDVAVYGVVNNVGISSNGMSWKLETAEFERILRGNVLPTFLCTKHFLPGMRTRKSGRIINISSVVAQIGAAGASHYATAKAGILGFTRSVAREVVKSGITVNAVALGYMELGIINTIPAPLLEDIKGQIPMARLGSANEVGGTISWLLSPEAAYLTGQVVHVNGGLAG